jgi:hypothetical protein
MDICDFGLRFRVRRQRQTKANMATAVNCLKRVGLSAIFALSDKLTSG